MINSTSKMKTGANHIEKQTNLLFLHNDDTKLILKVS